MTLRWRLRRAWRVVRGTAWESDRLQGWVDVVAIGGPDLARRFLRESHDDLAAISTAQYHEQLKRLGLEEG